MDGWGSLVLYGWTDSSYLNRVLQGIGMGSAPLFPDQLNPTGRVFFYPGLTPRGLNLLPSPFSNRRIPRREFGAH